MSRVAMLDLADALGAGRLKPPYSSFRIAGCVPDAVAVEVGNELARLEIGGMEPAHIAECLRLLAAERQANQQVIDRLQLVWTGPDVPGSVSRDTGVVVRELFASARRSVLLSSFTVRRGKEVFATLAEAAERNPAIQVRLVVNVGREGDYSSSAQQIVTRFADEFWKNDWPWPNRPCVYYDPRALSSDPAICASLHAKCVLIDDEVAFVTSANFT